MELAQFYTAGAFAAGLALTLFLAAYLTPRRWWRRPNARALLVMVVGAWGLGSLILAWSGVPQAATAHADAAISRAAPPALSATELPAQTTPAAGKPFQVHRDLNLRGAAGVHAARLLTVRAGATVTPTGVRDGDWWQIRVSVDGRDSVGWASSLWLRRSGE